MKIPRPLLAVWLFTSVCTGCSPNGLASAGADAPGEATVGDAPGVDAPACAPFSVTEGPLPEVEPKHLSLEFWIEQLKAQYDLDEVLLAPKQIATLNAALQVPREEYHAQRDLLAPLDVATLEKEVGERRVWARDKLGSAEYVSASGAALPAAALAILGSEVPLTSVRPTLRVALGDVMIHCAPLLEGFFSPALDLRLDRNACSTLRAQDVVRVIGEWPNGMQLVEAEYSFGWIAADAPLSPPIPAKLEEAFVQGPALQVAGQDLVVAEGALVTTVPVGTRLPAIDKRSRHAYVATSSGFVSTSPKQEGLLSPTARGLTRRALLEEAWRFIGMPYGLGDTNGGRDCSRLLLDVFGAFDLHLPRHSSWQSKAGSFWIDTQHVPEAERPLLFDAAAKKGIVLLHFPGHIMLYLGRNEVGDPMVLHALGEYLEPCGGRGTAKKNGETLVRVKNITVSNLELGRGTSRTALIERVTRITVIGGNPGTELAGVAQMRPVAVAKIPPDRQCQDSEKAAIYVLPEQPNQAQPLRIVAANTDDPGPAALTLIDPDGQRLSPQAVRLGGPPFGQVVTIENPKRGKWKAVFADGDTVLSCQRISVGARRPKPNEPDAGPIWKPKYRWNVANENLYALFVERLFDYELSEDRVWPNLHSLLRDKDRNVLFDYRGLDEDSEIELVPDCADLPYALRSYFAWKLRLPFGYRRCTRGRANKPPSCDEPGASDNLMSRLELPGKGGRLLPRGDVEAFELFINNELRSAVHSSSGRTSPEDELTDLYPVALTREALKPGTVFADPYGHFLVIADWIPQGPEGYGILVGADAQPDGTVGQRRFWRGTFLFDPDTKGGGAGFKAFRPRSFVEEPVNVELELDALSAANAAKTAALTGLSFAPAAPPGALSGGNVLAAPPVAPPTAPEAPRAEEVAAEEVAAEASAAATQHRAGDELIRIERIGFLEEVENKELRRSQRYNQLSLQQYKGSSDDFYSTLEALINPRPLEPKSMLRSLVDAFSEAVTRRVLSVANGEKWVAEHPGEVVPMPEGDGIFLSAGPWEDFSTPSRDLRLLIATDTVLGFAKSVRRAPERFGLRPEEVDAKLAELGSVLSTDLAKRTFSYTRSDGREQRLTLEDVVDRAAAFEVAYNPNDCVEVRWGAPPGSAELASCQRHAPPDQHEKMLSYRGWFSTRKRPPQ